MNRWALLEHTVKNTSLYEVHFDLLIENGSDCLTWKIYEIPRLGGSLIKIKKQPNHRLIWLSTDHKKLTKARGYVKRIDYGKYSILENNLLADNFSLHLQGNLIRGIFLKKDDSCQLCEII